MFTSRVHPQSALTKATLLLVSERPAERHQLAFAILDLSYWPRSRPTSHSECRRAITHHLCTSCASRTTNRTCPDWNAPGYLCHHVHHHAAFLLRSRSVAVLPAWGNAYERGAKWYCIGSRQSLYRTCRALLPSHRPSF